MRAAWTVLAAALSAVSATGQDRDEATEFWPELDLRYKISPETRLTFSVLSSRDRDVLKYDRAVELYLDYYVPYFKGIFSRRISEYDDSRVNRLVLRIAYRYDHSFHQSPSSYEHRPYADAILRWVFPFDVLATDRNRLELRFRNSGYSWRYRNRFRLEKDFKLGWLTSTPYISAEAYHDSHAGNWNEFQFDAGALTPIKKRLAVELYYSRQITEHVAERNVNGLGLTLDIYLRR
jgi:Protein of unknown function (DUF2490)